VRRILLLAGIWGWSFLFIKVAVAGMTPPTLACLRCALGALALLALGRARGIRLPRDAVSWKHFAVMGLIYSAVPFTLLGWGEQRTTSALAAVCQADTPLFAALFSVLLLGERLRRAHVLGLVIGFTGVAICAGAAGGDLAHSSSAGAMAEVASGASYGLAFCYARRHLGGIAPLVAATGQVITGTLLALPLAVATSLHSGIQLTPARLGAVAILGVVGTGIAYAINYASIADVGATRASLVTYLIPVVAVAVGIVVLGEPFELRVVAGGVVIVAGISLVQDRVAGLRRRLLRVPLVGTALATLLLGACSSSGSASGTAGIPASGCARTKHDPLDPRSVTHVLPGAPEPPYLTDPPTSGEHQVVVVRNLRGSRSQPLTRPVQVGLLEKGQVLIQYRPGPGDLAASFSALAGNPLVTVAPDPGLAVPVVATAWTWRLRCGDGGPRTVSALEAFVSAHAGKGPEQTPPGS